MYSFTVSSIEDIDLDRIIRENAAEGVHATIIPFNSGDEEKGLLLLSNELLSQFSFSDNCIVAKNAVGPDCWGYSTVVLRHKGHCLRDVRTGRYHNGSRRDLESGRAKVIDGDFDVVAAEIQAALYYQRRIKVDVQQLKSRPYFD